MKKVVKISLSLCALAALAFILHLHLESNKMASLTESSKPILVSTGSGGV